MEMQNACAASLPNQKASKSATAARLLLRPVARAARQAMRDPISRDGSRGDLREGHLLDDLLRLAAWGPAANLPGIFYEVPVWPPLLQAPWLAHLRLSTGPGPCSGLAAWLRPPREKQISD